MRSLRNTVKWHFDEPSQQIVVPLSLIMYPLLLQLIQQILLYFVHWLTNTHILNKVSKVRVGDSVILLGLFKVSVAERADHLMLCSSTMPLYNIKFAA